VLHIFRYVFAKGLYGPCKFILGATFVETLKHVSIHLRRVPFKLGSLLLRCRLTCTPPSVAVASVTTAAASASSQVPAPAGLPAAGVGVDAAASLFSGEVDILFRSKNR
jgi:hypothetical protein